MKDERSITKLIGTVKDETKLAKFIFDENGEVFWLPKSVILSERFIDGLKKEFTIFSSFLIKQLKKKTPVEATRARKTIKCPHVGCDGINKKHHAFCGTCKMRIKQSKEMKKRGQPVKISADFDKRKALTRYLAGAYDKKPREKDKITNREMVAMQISIKKSN